MTLTQPLNTVKGNAHQVQKSGRPGLPMAFTQCMAASLTMIGLLFSLQAEASEDTIASSLMNNVTDTRSVSEGYAQPIELWRDDSQQKATSRSRPHYYDDPEIWVADLETLLYNDADQDGYYTSFRLLLDVDVDWDIVDVYAKIYLQPDGADEQLFYTTEVFTLFNTSSTDRYRVDVDLYENYAPDDYDLIIDIVNAHTGKVVDSVSDITHRNLDDLPLESGEYQSKPHSHGDDDHDHDQGHDHDHGHDHGHNRPLNDNPIEWHGRPNDDAFVLGVRGGSAGPLTLLLLAVGTALTRLRRHR